MKARVVLAWLLAACDFHAPVGVADRDDADTTPDTSSDATDAPPDGTPDASIDACPNLYTPIQGQVSRYRILATAASFKVQHTDCKNDELGSTHLVVFQTVQELTAVRAFAGAADAWVGVVQRSDAVAVDEGWFALTGAPVTGLWKTNEPNDNDDVEDGLQQVAKLISQFLEDKPADEAAIGICECDGTPIDPLVEAHIP